MNIKFVLLPIHIFLFTTGCSSQLTEQYSAESYDIKLIVENADTGQLIPNKEVNIFYDLSSGDKLFTNPIGEAMPEDQQDRTYMTNSMGEIATELYALEGATLMINIQGGARYSIPTEELEYSALINLTEADRTDPWIEIEYPIDLTVEVSG